MEKKIDRLQWKKMFKNASDCTLSSCRQTSSSPPSAKRSYQEQLNILHMLSKQSTQDSQFPDFKSK
jgi:hypothetical protein